MENLFSTNLAINNQNLVYHVVFDNEQYQFLSETDQPEFPSFSIKRIHDEWVDQDALPADLKKQAIDALEKFLMKQH